jgi:hypothetical protein
MDKDDETRRHARMEPDTAAVDPSTPVYMQRWVRLRAQLSPLIGENGFGALFGRATALAAPRFPCLALDALPKNGDQLFAALAEKLSALDPTVASAANEALIRQLTSLIGAALTTRLLASATEGGDVPDLDRSMSK